MDCPILFLWRVFDIDMDPDGPGDPKEPDKEDTGHGDQQGKGTDQAPSEDPVDNGDKRQAEPAGQDIGQEHGAIIESGLRSKILLTAGAMIVHRERSLEGKTARRKHPACPAPGAGHRKKAGDRGWFHSAKVGQCWPILSVM